MDDDNRWQPFSDDELQDLLNATCIHNETYYLYREVLGEIQRRRREREAPTYTGPGFYKNRRDGTSLHVVGDYVARNGVKFVVVGAHAEDPAAWAMPAVLLDDRIAGERVFERTLCA